MSDPFPASVGPLLQGLVKGKHKPVRTSEARPNKAKALRSIEISSENKQVSLTLEDCSQVFSLGGV